jgi:hypothetical protein
MSVFAKPTAGADPATVAVLTFPCGPWELAIAANDVDGLSIATDELYIGALFDVEAELALSDSDRRTITVTSASGRASFAVDVPVRLVRLSTANILPSLANVPFSQSGLVLGFAEVEEQLLVLLDIPSVVRSLRAMSGGAT